MTDRCFFAVGQALFDQVGDLVQLSRAGDDVDDVVGE